MNAAESLRCHFDYSIIIHKSQSFQNFVRIWYKTPFKIHPLAPPPVDGTEVLLELHLAHLNVAESHF
jgi:hypothetical protein